MNLFTLSGAHTNGGCPCWTCCLSLVYMYLLLWISWSM